MKSEAEINSIEEKTIYNLDGITMSLKYNQTNYGVEVFNLFDEEGEVVVYYYSTYKNREHCSYTTLERKTVPKEIRNKVKGVISKRTL